jgi:crossover junction endodeoxyribonuclease RuvC
VKVIGVDPGSRVTGYGVIEFDSSGMVALDHGCIKPPSGSPLSKRYVVIYDALEGLISQFGPQQMAVEAPFYCKNVSSALKLSQVRGVILLAGSKNDLDIYEYSPRKVKQAVVGSGAAAKRQIQRMVAEILSLSKPPASEDAADALAVAICHIHYMSGPHSRPQLT